MIFLSGCTQYMRADRESDAADPAVLSVLKKKKIVFLGMMPFKTEQGRAVNPYSGDPDFLKMLLFIGRASEHSNSEDRFNFSTYRSSGKYGGGYQSWKRVPDSANSLMKKADYGSSLNDVKFGAADTRVDGKNLAEFMKLYYLHYGFYAFPDLKKIAVFPKDEKQKNQLNFSLKARSSDADCWVIVLPSAAPGNPFPWSDSRSF